MDRWCTRDGVFGTRVQVLIVHGLVVLSDLGVIIIIAQGINGSPPVTRGPKSGDGIYELGGCVDVVLVIITLRVFIIVAIWSGSSSPRSGNGGRRQGGRWCAWPGRHISQVRPLTSQLLLLC